jgi:hypothetical protein
MIRQLTRAVVTIAFVSFSAGQLQAAPVKTSCGRVIQKTVISNDASTPFQTTSSAAVRVPGAAQNVTVPSGDTRCIKVTFSGGMSCQGNGDNANCFIRARADTTNLSPGQISGNDMRNVYQWVGELGAGTHPVQIQIWRTSINAGALARVDDWVMDVEVLEAR